MDNIKQNINLYNHRFTEEVNWSFRITLIIFMISVFLGVIYFWQLKKMENHEQYNINALQNKIDKMTEKITLYNAQTAKQAPLLSYSNEITRLEQQVDYHEEILEKLRKIINDSQKGQHQQLLLAIKNHAREEVKLTKINIKKNWVLVQGYAPTTEDIIQWVSSIEQVTGLDVLNFPYLNIQRKTHQRFDFVLSNQTLNAQ
ncbi:MAG: hypothetical protein AAGB12_13525 [Pseudomonadota bacterium]